MRGWVLLSVLFLLAAGHQASQPAPAPLQSRVVDWNTLVPTETRTGQRRDVFDGPTATLDRLHGHITTLNPGENTGPLHRHPQEEMVIIKEGTVEVNENENMTNVGRTPATYLVLQWFTPRTPKS